MVNNEKEFRESLPYGFSGLFDWDFLLPIFAGTRISPMDIDFCLEKNDNILLMETKKDGGVVGVGQSMTYLSLYRRGGVTLVKITMKRDSADEKDVNGIITISVLEALDRATAKNKEIYHQYNWVTYTSNEDFGDDGKQWLYEIVNNWYIKACETKYEVK
jgi:hypothetical protein